jgi:hypothetical protein
MTIMKNSISRLVAVMLLLSAGVLGTGCNSTSSGPKGAYPSLKDTDRNVAWPMTKYRNMVAAGNLTLAERERITQDYAEYRAAYESALQAAQSNSNATTPDNVKQLANKVIRDVAAATP